MKHTTATVGLLYCLLSWPAAHAASANPDAFDLTQPDGTVFVAHQDGDEWFHFIRLGDRLIDQRADGWWCYQEVVGGLVALSGNRVVLDTEPTGVATVADLWLLRATRAASAPSGSPPSSPAAAAAVGAPPTGPDDPAVVLLVEFSDEALTYPDAAWATDVFGTMGYTVRSFYLEASQNQFTFAPAQETGGTVDDGVIRVTLGTPHPDPSSTGAANRQLTEDALIAADPFINYASYDANGNGRLSADELHIIVVPAGCEDAFGGGCAPGVWGHRWSVGSPPNLDGVDVGGGGYTQFGERHGGHKATIGIICHELGHDIGLPDLYDTDQSSEGIGGHGVMGAGSWGRSGGDAGSIPCLFCAWSREQMGFVTPTQIFVAGTYAATEASDTMSGNIFKIVPTVAAAGEYFLVENRQQTGFDLGLDRWYSPGGGLQIWHIDNNQTNNRDETHKLVDLEEANEMAAGGSELDASTSAGKRAHLFYGGGTTDFNDGTMPDAGVYSGSGSGLFLSNVSTDGTVITFDIFGGGLPGAPVPTCTITAPAPGGTGNADVAVTFDGADTGNTPLTSTFEYSLDGGTTWIIATTAAASTVANPDPARVSPFVGVAYLWDSVSDIGLGGPTGVDFRVTVDNSFGTASCQVAFSVDNRPFCQITAPTAGPSLAGAVTVDFLAGNPVGTPVTSTLEFSVDGGMTWALCTAAPGSPVSNPDPMRAVPSGTLSFWWNTRADALGVTGSQAVELRITTTDGMDQTTCSLAGIMIDNQPSCTLTGPVAGPSLAGAVTLTFNASDPSNDSVTSTFEFSVDGGVTWAPCTTAAGSPTANPDPMRSTPTGSVSYSWDTSADGLGSIGVQGVDLRVRVDDGAAQNSCTRSGIMIDNQPFCAITAPIAGATLDGEIAITWRATDPANDQVTSTFEFSTDSGATWTACTAHGSSATTNPDPTRGTPFSGIVFTWDSQADGLGLAGTVPVDVRVTAMDVSAWTTCARSWMVDNEPSCSISLPASGTSTVDVTRIRYNGFDPANDVMTSWLEFSTDSGATWAMCTTAPGSPTGNPDIPRMAPYFGINYDWDTQADGVGNFGPQGVDVRVTVDDTFTTSSCTVDLVVDNQPSCNFAQPNPGAMVSGSVAIVFDGADPSADPLTTTFEWSSDAGATWSMSTPAPGSPTTNPDPMRPAPFLSALFLWDSVTDGAGYTMVQPVELRMRVDDGSGMGTCSRSVTVDNVPPAPTCTINTPGGTVATGQFGFEVDTSSVNSMAVDILVEWSTDSGVTFNPCTFAAGAPNPLLGAPLGVSVLTWDSRADGIALMVVATGVELRASLDDGVSPLTGTCGVTVDVDNTCICGDCDGNGAGPNILDSLAAAQVGAGLIMPTMLQQVCCDVNATGAVDVIDSLLIAQVAAGLPVSIMCP